MNYQEIMQNKIMKILDSNKKNFYVELDKIINRRKEIDRSTLKNVEKIINDVRRKVSVST